MSKCDFCGKEVTLPFQCQYCNGLFCNEHRLPENHKCVGLELKKPIFRYSKGQKTRRSDLPIQISIPTKQIGSDKTKGKGKKIAISIVIITISILLIVMFALNYSPVVTNEPKFNIDTEIENLQNERPSWNQYTIHEHNWKVWKKQAEAVDYTFIKMDTWNEFKESLNQNSLVWMLMLDKENRVISYTPTIAVVIYYSY